MGYVVTKQGTLGENFHRIVDEELSSAIQILRRPGKDAEVAIHTVRKRIKKIRAVWRLVRSELGKELFQQENIRYRNIGHQLSGLRDATVMIQTLDKVKAIYGRKVPRGIFTKLRHQLSEQQREASEAFFRGKDTLPSVVTALEEAQEHNPLLIGVETFAALEGNLNVIYKQAIKALQVATAEPDIEHFHELRKQIKILWYATRLFTPWWPGFFEAYAQQLGTLSELLGDEHDLGVLANEIEASGPNLGRRLTVAKLLTLIVQRRETLQQQIYPLAKRVLAEKPDAFVHRYQAYWAIWQAE